jgi:ligand-binding SRPBCC domain-containing protein
VKRRRIVVETLIRAPREVVFDARFPHESLHESRVFGIPTRFDVRVVEAERPARYVDEATHRAFRMLRHVHEFIEVDGGTLMRDTVEYESPFGAMAGWVLRRFVKKRASALGVRRPCRR